ncbi:conjugative transposon protein TraM [Chryseobacterium shandongense]|uniref:Conjugative transposon protein TraM n=1 Tax=Chryseobacterium shandongense TaxID=1493872 RepID=A0AAD0YA51_9FLAO|nr:conjugative transposon protein TraM [Chryseobacterium shandongense]AZA85447.1 conjugative transposon protein TraM [Chryseobacterium shandongense]AZA97554.1 conjugative transposon protein TraM [Chryseobacterium shandongense]
MNNENRTQIRITEGDIDRVANEEQTLNNLQRLEKFKKPIIYFLMAVVCAGCLYLIFKPKDKNVTVEEVGFNSAVPQAADDKLQSDKQKAYEQQLLEQKNEENRNKLTSLSDYWSDNQSTNLATQSSPLNANGNSETLIQGDQNAMNSYRNAQQTLGSFYSRDDQEVSNLKREISRLKNESQQSNSTPKGSGINEQLELMEKSYQLAAKYLPSSSQQNQTFEEPKASNAIEKSESKETQTKITTVKHLNKNVVSALYREPSDSAFLAGLTRNSFTGIQNNSAHNNPLTTNSIRAVIHQTQLITNESLISLRLTEPMILGNTKIPDGTLLKASCKFQGGRLQMKVSSIEYQGSIQPVEINIHDNDGQLGLQIPQSPEQNALNDIVANMSQTSGTNIMMTQSAGQQIASDLTRGVVQGVSGYFQKRVRMPKVTVKAGHQILLVAK